VNLDRVEKIAEAVLYEGYMLYPYRPSSVKNQQRWNFGVLCPQTYCEWQQGSEAWKMQTECLVKATSSTRLSVKLRFLQIVRRTVGRLCLVGQEEPEGVEPRFEPVDCIEVVGRVYQPWEEVAEREHTSVALDPNALSSLSSLQLSFPAGRQFEYLRDEQGCAIGVLIREWEALTASVQFDSMQYRDGVVKITVLARNLTSFNLLDGTAREDALAFSLISAHTILGVEQGKFLSLLDPPAGVEELVSQCSNIGTWPVLVGDQADMMLSSPIILYDHPQIAPESAGNLFDSTEIDEILSLRILTLTDDEKREMRQSDDRARQILERTENMPKEQFMKLHGALRGLTQLRGEAR
jgi:hydrogenase maturation protease